VYQVIKHGLIWHLENMHIME